MTESSHFGDFAKFTLTRDIFLQDFKKENSPRFDSWTWNSDTLYEFKIFFYYDRIWSIIEFHYGFHYRIWTFYWSLFASFRQTTENVQSLLILCSNSLGTLNQNKYSELIRNYLRYIFASVWIQARIEMNWKCFSEI